MKKACVITKIISQIFLYFLEVLGISLMLTSLSNNYIPYNNWFEIVERITIFYALYQLIICNILQQLNDIKKDEYLALLTMYKYVDIYNSNKDENIKNYIYDRLNKQLDSGMLNDFDIRNEYKDIKSIIDNNESFNDSLLKMKIAKYEHLCEYANLNWRYSILLRIFK